jgi:TRAP transporter TAXI family solute receptor
VAGHEEARGALIRIPYRQLSVIIGTGQRKKAGNMEEIEAGTQRPSFPRTRRGRRWLVGVMALVFAGSLAGWYTTRDTLPREIVIAAGPGGGLYDTFAQALASRLRTKTGHQVRLLTTAGSVENRERLLTGAAHLGILQAGAVSMRGLRALAPLYPEAVHILVRQKRGIRSIADLSDRHVAIGPERSGTRALALQILDYYHVDPRRLVGSTQHFDQLVADPSLDAAIITTGLLNPDLAGVLRSGKFDLLSIEDAGALSLHFRYLAPFTIPRGAIAEGPAVPDRPVTTVATTAVLAARSDAGATLVRAALETLYNGDLQDDMPCLTPAAAARAWTVLPLHDAARRYFDPYQGLDTLSAFLQSLSAGKELLFALGAGIFLLWERWKRAREREHEREVRAGKEQLDRYLTEAIRIERAQMGAWDRETLRLCLDEVTRVKLDALESLTHESLRGDRLFLIFLTQCASLIQKIQLKLELGEAQGEKRPLASP